MPGSLATILAITAAYGLLVFAGATLRTLGGDPSASLAIAAAVVGGLAAIPLLLARPRPTACSDEPGPARTQLRFEAIGVGILLLITLLLAFLHIDRWPGFRGDESLMVEFAANRARYGTWSLRTGLDLEPLTWMISTGPPVIFPMAFAYSTCGASVGAVRAASGVYLLLAAVSTWAVARFLHGAGTALVAGLTLLSFYEVTNTGRMALGDFAAVAFLLCGVLGWLHALESGRPGRSPSLWLASLALGLMVLTKMTTAIAGLGFLAYALVDRTGDRRIRWCHLIVPVLTVAALNLPWELYKAAQTTSLVTLMSRNGDHGVYAIFDLGGTVAKTRELASRPETPLALAGLVWSWWSGGRARRGATLIAAIATLPLLWWLTFRIVLDRYLILPSILALLLAAPLIATAVDTLRQRRRQLDTALALGVVTVGLLLPAGRTLANLMRVVSAPTGEWSEPQIARVLSEQTHGAEPLYADELPHGLLFFLDRPIVVIAPDDVRQLPAGSYVLGRPDRSRFSAATDLELVAETETLLLYRHR